MAEAAQEYGPYEIDRFCIENRLDEEARKVLMDLEPDLLKEVLQQGAVMGARNPNAVLLSRIRRVRAGEVKGKSIVPRAFDPEKVDALITQFVQEHDLDDRAERTLRESDDDIVREICGTKLTDCRNASAVVVSRARQLRDDRAAGLWQGKGAVVAAAAGLDRWSSWHPPATLGHPPAPPPTYPGAPAGYLYPPSDAAAAVAAWRALDPAAGYPPPPPPPYGAAPPPHYAYGKGPPPPSGGAGKGYTPY